MPRCPPARGVCPTCGPDAGSRPSLQERATWTGWLWPQRPAGYPKPPTQSPFTLLFSCAGHCRGSCQPPTMWPGEAWVPEGTMRWGPCEIQSPQWSGGWGAGDPGCPSCSPSDVRTLIARVSRRGSPLPARTLPLPDLASSLFGDSGLPLTPLGGPAPMCPLGDASQTASEDRRSPNPCCESVTGNRSAA